MSQRTHPDPTGAGDDAEPGGTGGGENRSRIGGLLRDFRRKRLLSQEAAAELTGLSPRTFRYLESGRVRRPHPDTVRRLTGGLDLSPAEQALLERAWGVEVGSAGPAPEPPVTLPPTTQDFCGREDELDQVLRALTPTVQDGALVAVAVSGKPGVGKTALALQVAHRLRVDGRFPDGQLYVDLRGSGPTPADPVDVLGRLLTLLGVDATVLPRSLEDRADRFRTLLARRRVLFVLDNADTEAQVRPLLPGTAGSAMLVTSRTRLSGLEGGQLVDLDVLPPTAAVRLLAGVVGPERAAAEADAAREIVTYCGWLPLAIRIAGARLAVHPDWTLAGLARRLADERSRLDELETGDLEVRASFALSYQSLPQPGRRLFRRLGLLDIVDVPGWVAAAIMDVPHREGVRLIERLCAANLVESAGQDGVGQPRYRQHDLLRVYAAEQSEAETAADRSAVLARVAGGWLALAERAAPAVPAGTLGLVHGDAARGRPDPRVIDAVGAAPVDWLEVEHKNLTAMVLTAGAAGLDDVAWDLAGCLGVFYTVRTHFEDWRRSQEAGIDAARRAGHRAGEAHLLRSLGHLRSEQDHLDLATDCFQRAQRIFVETGDRRGEAGTLDDLGIVHHLNGRSDLALETLQQAEAAFGLVGDRIGQAHVRFSLGMLHLDQGEYGDAEARLLDAQAILEGTGDGYTVGQILRKLAQLYRTTARLGEAAAVLDRCLLVDRALGDRLAEALTLQSLGEVRRRQNRRTEAGAILETALDTFRSVGYPYGEALVLRSLGDLRLADGRPGAAVTVLRRSLAVWQQLGRPRNEAHTLASLGGAYALLGDTAEADHAWRQALDLYEQLGAPEAVGLAAQLA